MKNLKRALSLVLSAAMMVGMMVVGTSAAFADVDTSDNLEAIEVMKMIGVMEGVDEDNFAPDRVVTRNEMAVVICNLMDLKLNGYHPFTDVPEWADPYVGAMYVNGLTSGTSATTYGGSANVTTVEAALMILKTLGYFEYEVEFEGDWSLATAKRATLEELFDKVNAGIKDGLTRGEVAQMVLNALDNGVVVARDASSNISVEGNGMNVNITDNDYGYEPTGKTLMAKLFDDKLVGPQKGKTDAFGRPSVKWTYTGNGKTETVTAPKAATHVLTAKTNEDAMTKLLKDYEASSITAWIDGKIDATIAKGGVYAYTGDGATVEIYTDSKTNTITDVVVVNEYAGKVYSVTKADDKTGAKRYVTVDGMKFDTENFAKKDRVVYTKAMNDQGDYVIKSMKAAEFVEGEITGITYDAKTSAIKSVKIDGVSYKYNPCYTGTTVKIGDDVKMVIDSNGNLLMSDTVTAAAPSVDEYVVVTNTGRDGFEAAQIKVLKVDGTTEVVGFEQYIDEEDATQNSLASVSHNTMYTMEDADNDGKYEFYNYETTKISDKYAGFDAIAQGTSLNAKDDNLANGWSIADEAVVFSYNTTKKEWSVTTGAKLAAADKADVVVAYANKDASGFYAVELACVESTMSSSSDVLYGYVTADIEDVKNSDKVTVDSVTFWNGEETVTALTDKANANKGLVKGSFFTYKLNGDGELTDVKVEPMTAAAVTAYNGEKIAFANADLSAIGTYELDDEIVVIYVDAEEKAGAEDGEIEIADKTDDEAAYILNVKYALDSEGKKVVAMFVDVLNDIADAI